jgi:hypothetical protein
MDLLDTLKSIVAVANQLSPLGAIALLSGVVYQLVAKRGTLRRLTDNHASHAQSSLEQIAITLERVATSSEKQLNTLQAIQTDIAFVKGKLD